jgi:hypothetical protein
MLELQVMLRPPAIKGTAMMRGFLLWRRARAGARDANAND